jgi:hypothetical protein
MTLSFRPATTDRWDDVVALFGERGSAGRRLRVDGDRIGLRARRVPRGGPALADAADHAPGVAPAPIMKIGIAAGGRG